jgi:hypothetical protein
MRVLPRQIFYLPNRTPNSRFITSHTAAETALAKGEEIYMAVVEWEPLLKESNE